MSISTANQAYAVYLLDSKKNELTNEAETLKGNPLNFVKLNTKQKKIAALTKLIQKFTDNPININEDAKAYYKRVISAFFSEDKASYEALISSTFTPSRVSNFIDNDLLQKDSPLHIEQRDQAIHLINEKIDSIPANGPKNIGKRQGLLVLITLLTDSKHFDSKSVADVIDEYKTSHAQEYNKAIAALIGSDTKDMLGNIAKNYTAKPEQNKIIHTYSYS